VGHRGGGAERGAKSEEGPTRTHVRENTILSFGTAALSGAHYVEFDVQLTRDRVPVLYHDFRLKYNGLMLPISSLTLEQFKKLGDRQKLTRSKSMEDIDVKSPQSLLIHDAYPTFQQVIEQVPETVGFDVEIKYPMQDEMSQFDLHAIDRNTYVDTILWTLFEHARGRKIIFSSFDPDTCLLLAAKQHCYPVFFLSEVGTVVRGDPRCNSLEASIEFAKSANLTGLVCPARAFLKDLTGVQLVKDAGLWLCTWGKENNTPANVHTQKVAGVNGIIVDHVNHIAKHWNNTYK